MTDWPLFSVTSTVSEVETDEGMVVGPDPAIAEAGAEVLRQGGNAVDAAVAAAFATGVVEPGAAGLGGSVTMTMALRDPDRLAVVEGHMIAPKGVRPEHYPLAASETKRQHIEEVFGIPPVEGNVNLYGGKAVTVPGTAACLLTAQERYGALPREKVIEPAIRLAADGFVVNYVTSAYLTAVAPRMSQDPGLAEVFLPRGFPPSGPILNRPDRLVQPALAQTLEALAAKGAEAFYRGEIARTIVERVRETGGTLSVEDLEEYEPDVFEPPMQARYRAFTVIGAPHAGMPTVLSALYIHEAARGRGTPAEEAVAWARALSLAFIDRARYLTHDPDFSPPWEALSSRAYALARLQAAIQGSEPPDPRSFGSEVLAPIVARAAAPGNDRHTSQMAAVDRHGNVVSLTGTLMNAYGAQVMDPASGVVLNGGMAYFDPRPGRVNSIKPGVKVLSAMTPLVLLDEQRGPIGAVGASGGRRIISYVAQIIGALGHGETSIQRATEQPLIHSESEVVVLDARWPREAAEAVEAAGFRVVPTPESPSTGNFARPYGILIGPNGVRRSGVDPRKPAGIAIG